MLARRTIGLTARRMTLLLFITTDHNTPEHIHVFLLIPLCSVHASCIIPMTLFDYVLLGLFLPKRFCFAVFWKRCLLIV